MESYESLGDKWRARLEEGTASHNFDLEKMGPGKFCVLYGDCGGSMACGSSTEVVGCFEDARDFLGFLRFSEIARVLDFDSGTNRDPFPDVADAYLTKHKGEQREKIDHLLGRLDLVLKRDTADMISMSELCVIRDLFNQIFSQTNPQVEIMAWGSLADVLASSVLQEALAEAVDEEVGQVDEDEQPCTQLKALLDAGEFHEDHVALARGFLEKALSF